MLRWFYFAFEKTAKLFRLLTNVRRWRGVALSSWLCSYAVYPYVNVCVCVSLIAPCRIVFGKEHITMLSASSKRCHSQSNEDFMHSWKELAYYNYWFPVSVEFPRLSFRRKRRRECLRISLWLSQSLALLTQPQHTWATRNVSHSHTRSNVGRSLFAFRSISVELATHLLRRRMTTTSNCE